MLFRTCVAITIKCPQIFSLPIAMWRIFDKNEGPMTSPNLSKYLWKSCSISIFPHFIRDLCNAMEKSCDLSVSPSPFVLDFGTWDFELWLFNFFFEDYASKEKKKCWWITLSQRWRRKKFCSLAFHSSAFFILCFYSVNFPIQGKEQVFTYSIHSTGYGVFTLIES